MTTRIASCLVLVGALIAAPSGNALTVFADFDGDKVHDGAISVANAAPFVLSFYAEVDNAHGGLTGYGVELSYGEPPIGVVAPADVVSDGQWTLPETVSVASGSVEAFDGDLFGSFTGTVHLFDVTFAALAPGTTTMNIGNIHPALPLFDGFAGFDGFVYDAEVSFQPTVVTVVPEPGVLVLLSLGVLGFSCLAKLRMAGL